MKLDKVHNVLKEVRQENKEGSLNQIRNLKKDVDDDEIIEILEDMEDLVKDGQFIKVAESVIELMDKLENQSS
jgi:hypothetical protein